MSRAARQAWVAGRALASALGPDLASATAALRGGGVAPGRIELADGSSWPYFGITDDEPDWYVRARGIVQRVAADSGALAGHRAGALFVASSSLGMGGMEQHDDFEQEFPAFAETVARWIGWQGPVYTVSTACTSGLNALMGARALITHGVVDEALVLGLELRNRVTVGGFSGMQLLSPTAALPFGAQRNGLVLGEAAAALRLTAAPARWRIAGGANVVDGRDPAGTIASAVRAMCEQALRSAGLHPRDIHLVKPQAAGGVASDATEAQALRLAFGDALPPLVSFKAAIGHTLGASGVAELALLMASLADGAWPRAEHAPDPTLHAPLAQAAPPAVRHVLASILGFGGGHAAVVLEDCA